MTMLWYCLLMQTLMVMHNVETYGVYEKNGRENAEE